MKMVKSLVDKEFKSASATEDTPQFSGWHKERDREPAKWSCSRSEEPGLDVEIRKRWIGHKRMGRIAS